jgi:hypothetical protein
MNRQEDSGSQDQSLARRQERVSRNEGLFRAVNEQLEGLNDTFAVQTDTFKIVCECGKSDCVEQLAIPPQTYTRIRSDPTLFFVLPGHQDRTSEAVVEEARENYVVVQKYPGIPAETAAQA